MANTSQDYIDYICSLYGSSYDDRIENTAPPTAGDQMRIPGEDWAPGMTANHKSLQSFKKELEQQGIKLSTSKIKKILITGGLWTTETSRTIQTRFNSYTSGVEDGGSGMSSSDAVKRIAEELRISLVSVSVNLPYMDVVYNLPEPSANAKRCRRWKERKAARVENGSLWLWQKIIEHEGEMFTTSGRGVRPGVSFTYSISHPSAAGGRHYAGESVEGYGNELWIIKNGQRAEKSISRSTVDLALKKAQELNGAVKGPKALGIPGAGSYLYPMLIRFGVIRIRAIAGVRVK